VSFNSLDAAALSGFHADVGSWTSIWALTGIRLTGKVSPYVSLYGQGQLGVLFGSTPEITLSVANLVASQPSASASAVAFGLGAGTIVRDRFILGVRYMYAKPEYEVRATGGGMTVSGTAQQATGMFQLLAGFVW
jgi:hypothetical protein